MKVTLKVRVLKEYIARQNLTQNEFGERVGSSSGFMAQLLHGTRQPSAYTRARLCKTTKLSFDDLFLIEPEEEGK